MSSRPVPWWLTPWSIILVGLVPLTLFAHEVPLDPRMAPGLDYRTPATLLLAGAFLMAFALGTRLAQRLPATPDAAPADAIPPAALDVLGLLALFGYAVWFGPLVARPDLLVFDAGIGDPYRFRAVWRTIPGVTTLSQLAAVFVAVYAWRYLGVPARPGFRRHTLLLAVLLAATLFRVVVWNERLALFDLLIVTVAIGALRVAGRPRVARFIPWVPLMGAAGLYLSFTFFEVFRSWRFHLAAWNGDLFAFGRDRLVAYYATSLNNAAGLLTELRHRWPSPDMRHVAGWIHEFPILGALVAPDRPGLPFTARFVNRFGLPEFNTFSGLLTPTFDLGVVGAPLLALALGLVLGWAWRGFRDGRGIGALLYPLLLPALLDLPRMYMFGLGRNFPVYVGAVLVAITPGLLRRWRAWRAAP